MKRAAVLATATAALACPAAAQEAKPFATAADAFKAGVLTCHRSFEGLKKQQPFGREVASSPGFATTEDTTQPGLRSMVLNMEHVVAAKALLAQGTARAVYDESGAGQGGMPSCRVVAVNAPGAGALAKTWFEDASAGWEAKTEEQTDQKMGSVSRVYGRPFMNDIGVGATLTRVVGEPKGDITAVSSFSFAR